MPRLSPNYILYPPHSLNRIKGVFIAYRRLKYQDAHRDIAGEMWFGVEECRSDLPPFFVPPLRLEFVFR